jgi:hypothetical protein
MANNWNGRLAAIPVLSLPNVNIPQSGRVRPDGFSCKA